MLSNLQQELHKATNHLSIELSKLQAGRANPAIVENVFVMVYGSSQPLKNVAAVSALDAQTIVIQPWDKATLKDVEKGITDANLGLNPGNNGESIMIKIPPLTEERRRDLVKVASRLTEEGKVGVRNVRSDYKRKIDHAKAEKEISEDEAKSYESELQKQVETATKAIEDLFKRKEADIMKV